MRDYRHCSGEFKFRSQSLDIRASAGTHIDSPAHCFEGARDVSDLNIEELICPCIVIDVSQHAHERYKISVDDIENFEKKYGIIKPASFVLFYTGWSRFWNKAQQYHNNLVFPSVSAQTAQLLLESKLQESALILYHQIAMKKVHLLTQFYLEQISTLLKM